MVHHSIFHNRSLWISTKSLYWEQFDLPSFKTDLNHLPDWTFDRKRFKPSANSNLNLKPTPNPNYNLKPNVQKPFGENEMTSFSEKASRYGLGHSLAAHPQNVYSQRSIFYEKIWKTWLLQQSSSHKGSGGILSSWKLKEYPHAMLESYSIVCVCQCHSTPICLDSVQYKSLNVTISLKKHFESDKRNIAWNLHDIKTCLRKKKKKKKVSSVVTSIY